MGDLDGGLATGGGLIRGEQPGVDEPLNEPLVLFVPLREPGRLRSRVPDTRLAASASAGSRR